MGEAEKPGRAREGACFRPGCQESCLEEGTPNLAPDEAEPRTGQIACTTLSWVPPDPCPTQGRPFLLAQATNPAIHRSSATA